jgi:hypothetical protein
MFNEIPKNCRYGYARVSSKSQEDNSSLEAYRNVSTDYEIPPEGP